MKPQRGFTLIEVMIAVAIIAIIAAVAFPSYQSYLRKGHRGAAQTFLLDIANREQQYLLDARTYTTDYSGVLKLTPSTDLATRYTFAVEVPNPDAGSLPISFKISAIPKSGSSQASDGTLTLDDRGVKTCKGNPGWECR